MPWHGYSKHRPPTFAMKHDACSTSRAFVTHTDTLMHNRLR